MATPLFIKPLITLNTAIITFTELQNKWKCDKRYPESAIQRFIKLNAKSFDFLKIKAEGIFHEGKYALKLTTSNYVGCIPTYSPVNGKLFGDILVTGRFNEDIMELLSVTGDNILPEFNDSLELSSGEISKPPLYFECANFIDLYLKACKANWRKFDNKTQIKTYADASTQWEKYAITSIDPLQTFKYQNKNNILTCNHKEWQELTYILHLAISEIESIRTPLRSKLAYLEKINKLKQTYSVNTLRAINRVNIHMADPIIIKELKKVGNIILGDLSSRRISWRLDFAVFFEKYVQFLLQSIAREKGAKEFCNPHYGISGQHKPQWCLNYLEPDIIIQREDQQYVIDAKYKSHMFNVQSNSEDLRDTFRSDLHQVLAYTSLNAMKEKKGILIYPSSHVTVTTISIKSHLNGMRNQVQMIGIPLIKSEVQNVKKCMKGIIMFE